MLYFDYMVQRWLYIPHTHFHIDQSSNTGELLYTWPHSETAAYFFFFQYFVLGVVLSPRFRLPNFLARCRSITFFTFVRMGVYPRFLFVMEFNNHSAAVNKRPPVLRLLLIITQKVKTKKKLQHQYTNAFPMYLCQLLSDCMSTCIARTTSTLKS